MVPPQRSTVIRQKYKPSPALPVLCFPFEKSPKICAGAKSARQAGSLIIDIGFAETLIELCTERYARSRRRVTQRVFKEDSRKCVAGAILRP